MAENRSEAWERVQQMAADVNAQQMRVLQQYADIYRKYLTGNAPTPDPAKTATFFADEGTKYVQKVTELGLQAFNDLLEHSVDAAERYLALLGAAAGAAAEDAKADETSNIITNGSSADQQ